jgi:competence protein ComEA
MLSRLLTRKEQAILLVFAFATVLGAAALVIANRSGEESGLTLEPAEAAAIAPASTPPAPTATPTLVTPAPPAPAAVETSPAPVIVSLQGAVHRPDVYELIDGDRVRDVLEKAGGALENADLTNINLAAKLVDGTTLVVPSWDPNDYWSYQAGSNPPPYTIQQQNVPDPAPTPPPPPSGLRAQATPAPASGLINLNTATQEQLESLPGIGPTYAKEIIRFRTEVPFRTVDDVGQVRGIGPKRLEAIRPLVTVQ